VNDERLVCFDVMGDGRKGDVKSGGRVILMSGMAWQLFFKKAATHRSVFMNTGRFLK